MLKVTDEEARMVTERHLSIELNKILVHYMAVYDEYYKTGSRDSAFLKDLVGGIQGISAVLEVYVRDKKIHPNYVKEKLNNSMRYIESCLNYFEGKEDKND